MCTNRGRGAATYKADSVDMCATDCNVVKCNLHLLAEAHSSTH